MDTPLIITLVAVAVTTLIAFVVIAPRMRRKREEHKQELAREHLQEAQARSLRAEQEDAAAEEQIARARREQAEVAQRAAQAEREAQQRMETAQHERTEAGRLQHKAQELSPDVDASPRGDGYEDESHARDIDLREEEAARGR